MCAGSTETWRSGATCSARAAGTLLAPVLTTAFAAWRPTSSNATAGVIVRGMAAGTKAPSTTAIGVPAGAAPAWTGTPLTSTGTIWTRRMRSRPRKMNDALCWYTQGVIRTDYVGSCASEENSQHTKLFALKSCAKNRVITVCAMRRSAPTRRDRAFPALQGSRGTPVAELLFSFAVGATRAGGPHRDHAGSAAGLCRGLQRDYAGICTCTVEAGPAPCGTTMEVSWPPR